MLVSVGANRNMTAYAEVQDAIEGLVGRIKWKLWQFRLAACHLGTARRSRLRSLWPIRPRGRRGIYHARWRMG